MRLTGLDTSTPTIVVTKAKIVETGVLMPNRSRYAAMGTWTNGGSARGTKQVQKVASIDVGALHTIEFVPAHAKIHE